MEDKFLHIKKTPIIKKMYLLLKDQKIIGDVEINEAQVYGIIVC